MTIFVNETPREIPAGTTLAGLVAQLGLADAPCAAEVNRQLVPKREHADRVLCEGDRIELVTLVGGG